MNFILDAIAADPNIAPAFRAAIKAPQFFMARTGRRRQFLSQRDADAYDRGYASFQSISDAPPLDRGPFGDGWFDAFDECDHNREDQ
jgi:hypothetical protein